MSRLLAATITGSSLTIFSDRAVVFVIAAESSSDAVTETVSVTPIGFKTRSTRIWMPALRFTPSPVAGANPSFVMSTR